VAATKPYRVLIGVNYMAYGKGRIELRAEPGDVVTNLPPAVIEAWLVQGVIEEAD
jgi:hypothetical protein